MREIRFRAWDYTQNKIRIVTDLMSVCDGSWNVSYDGGENYTGDIVLMQYTGLHDKKGKEIYEGDIVRLKWKDAGNHAKQTIRSVQWNGNGYGCALTEYECEVIGNVWENPELLGGAA